MTRRSRQSPGHKAKRGTTREAKPAAKLRDRHPTPQQKVTTMIYSNPLGESESPAEPSGPPAPVVQDVESQNSGAGGEDPSATPSRSVLVPTGEHPLTGTPLRRVSMPLDVASDWDAQVWRPVGPW